VTDLDGASVLEGDMSVLVTNGRLHEEFLQLVNGLPHSRDYRALDDGE
jgi:histidinol-phosphatase